MSAKTLRYYAEIGLILPSEINPETGYRYYAVEQLETMLLIIRLKSYNFSLEEIKQILGSGELGGDKLYAALTRKREDMKKQLHEQEKSLHQLECDISNLRTGKSILSYLDDIDIELVEISVDKNIYFETKKEQIDFYKSKGVNGWVADPSGTNTAGWGLSLTAGDMAKLGQLYLNGGYWNGRQIISGKWIAASTQVQSVWKARSLKYGYLWWIIDEAEHSFAALGDGGNAIYVNPKDRIDFIKSEVEPLFK